MITQSLNTSASLGLAKSIGGGNDLIIIFVFDSSQEWMFDCVIVPVAKGYGLGEEYQYLKSSIQEFLSGSFHFSFFLFSFAVGFICANV